ncbi:MAG: HlyD family efflux transporter periplasmic adaptor subunit [Phormidesmis sp.]
MSPSSNALLSSSSTPRPSGSRLKRLSPPWLIGLGLLSLLLIAVPIINKVRSDKTADAEAVTDNILLVETVLATSESSYTVSRVYTGEIATLQASNLGFERSGQLTALLVAEGARVSAGEPLARLDVQNLQTQRLQIEAEKAQALARLSELESGARSEEIAAASAAVQDLEQQIALQRVQLARREALYAQGAIAQEALDEFSFGEAALQARLDQARSQLRELQNGTRPEQIAAQAAVVQQLDARLADTDVTIAKSTLNAPFSGTVAAHTVDTGTVVGAGQSVVRLVESDVPEARVGLPVEAVSRLAMGDEQTVEVGGEQYTATVTAILPEVDAQTRTQTVVLALEPRAAEQVSPGQTVRLNLSDRINTAGIWLPAGALTQGIRGLWTCYVVTAEAGEEASKATGEATGETTGEATSEATSYVVQPQTVEVIHQDGDRVFVTGTLQPNDQIVASASHRLVPGQQVRPVEGIRAGIKKEITEESASEAMIQQETAQ